MNSIEAHARADVVFDFMTDVRNEPKWNPQMLRVEKPTPGEIGRGTRFRVRFGRGVGETIIENVTFDRFRSWTAVSRSRLLDVEAEGRVVDALSGCRLIMWSQLYPIGILRIAALLLGWWMHRTWDRDLRAASYSSRSPPSVRAKLMSRRRERPTCRPKCLFCAANMNHCGHPSL